MGRTDRTPPEVHAEVLERDKVCFIKKMDPGHQCRDRFRNPHRSDNRLKLTVDGVKQHARMGLRADHRYPWNLVAMCGFENNRPPSEIVRRAERAYLAILYPEQRKP